MRVPEAEAMAPTSRTEAGSALMERRMKAEEISIRRLNFSSLHQEESQTVNRKALEKANSGNSSDRETSATPEPIHSKVSGGQRTGQPRALAALL